MIVFASILRKTVLIVLFIVFFVASKAQMRVDTSKTIDFLVEHVLLSENSCVEIESVNFIGAKSAIGIFNCKSSTINLKRGIIMATGCVLDAIGPNEAANTGREVFYASDPDLSKISNGKTSDICILEIAFKATGDKVSFNYAFASEEYPEFVNKGVNDVFAFFISGLGIEGKKNIAVLPETDIPISVDNINDKENSEFYIANKLWKTENFDLFQKDKAIGELSFYFQYDGMTTILKAESNVIPGEIYKIKLAIADVGDRIYDSAVFLEANSLKSYSSKPLVAEDLASSLKGDKIEVEKQDDSIKVTMNIEFKLNSYEIPASSFDFLNKLSENLLLHPNISMQITGHTDDAGTSEYNLELSLNRADAILNYLYSKGIEKQRMHISGKGSTMPIALNKTEEGRAKNRRVEFLLYNQ